MIPKLENTAIMAKEFLKEIDPVKDFDRVQGLAMRSTDIAQMLISEGRALASDMSLSAPKREALASRVKELERTFSQDGRLQMAKERMVYAKKIAESEVSFEEARTESYRKSGILTPSINRSKMDIIEARNRAYENAKDDYEMLLHETSMKGLESYYKALES